MDSIYTPHVSNSNYIKKLITKNIFSKILFIVFIVVSVLLMVNGWAIFYTNYVTENIYNPWIIETTRNGKKRLVIKQDPNSLSGILLRSQNQKNGVEFSYTFWLYVNDWSYNYGQFKHIFHKGNEDSWPNRAPAVFLGKKKNDMYIYMNTLSTIDEFALIENIPIGKWIHFALIFKGQHLDVIVNGLNRLNHKYTDVIKQNYGNLYISNNRGFDGFLSRFRYYNRAVTHTEIEGLLQQGPSKAPCSESGLSVPFIADDWFISR